MGPRALLHRRELLQRQESRKAVSRRDVMRFLSRRTESQQSAEGSGTPEMGKPELQSGRAIFLGRSNLRVEAGSDELRVSAVPHVASGRTRYIVCLDRLHQQSAHDEFALQLWRADGGGEAGRQGAARGPGAEQ